MSLAQESNRYLEEKAPWKRMGEDRDGCATSIGAVLGAISCLKTILCPFLPFSSQSLHRLLGFAGRVEDGGWSFQVPPSGQKLMPPQPLFTKLDDDMVAEETLRLRANIAGHL